MLGTIPHHYTKIIIGVQCWVCMTNQQKHQKLNAGFNAGFNAPSKTNNTDNLTTNVVFNPTFVKKSVQC